jgi:hypothetical protein
MKFFFINLILGLVFIFAFHFFSYLAWSRNIFKYVSMGIGEYLSLLLMVTTIVLIYLFNKKKK